MKRYMLLFTCVLALGILCGCGAKEPSQSEMPENRFGLTMEVSDVTSEGLTLTCMRDATLPDWEVTTGSAYVIQKESNGTWADVPFDCTGDWGWTMELYTIDQNTPGNWKINWTNLCGELPAGTYRIGKDFVASKSPAEIEHFTVFAEFTITE